ncbi:hypothetical protein [Brevibacillus laterosporus]|uniref:Uncharacterized protein n=1 Tax=Brevibacillus laterosporus TaxID=1465 RepID=A0AAP3GDE4_BRELA|nr:hypothetical protein [Brevibacillus laterosporus]MCR8983084.1 hypothetical protein [Brevibacillus laterosporus]MCZ0810240.1 hypothetical protein [Brevibacillus laterosporus]MCZ0828905.1 hypothetical protein [Brevibacillus laterosporus]MCZ0852960.1 hypothetical protein [Brevibacillus laterosporus]
MEILSTVSNTGALISAICFGALGVIIGLIAFLCLINGDFMGITLLLASTILSGATYYTTLDYVTPRYEVTITDMFRFDTDKYQIIEQRGKVFVVKEIRR